MEHSSLTLFIRKELKEPRSKLLERLNREVEKEDFDKNKGEVIVWIKKHLTS